ncbi:MAG: hypothetical protein JWO70_4515 [Betaproteobacteria bacterium]|nr:hypothetical protein [Betaproteobacteria bacterium]
MSTQVMPNHAGQPPRVPSFIAPRWLISAFFLAVFFPFASPLPAATDTQPLAVGFALLILLWERLLPGKLKRSELYVLVPAVLALLFISPFSGEISDLDVGKYLALPAGVIVFVVAKDKMSSLNYPLFQAVIVIYFVWTILLLLSPGVFLPIQQLFVRGLNLSMDDPFGFRGVLTFATEPGLFGGLLVFFLIVTEYFYRAGQIRGPRAIAIAAMIFSMIVVSKSGAGYAYSLIYLFFLASRRPKLLVALALVVASLLLPFADAIVSLIERVPTVNLGRGMQALLLLAGGDVSSDWSMMARIRSLSAGIQALGEYPLGVGAANVNSALVSLSATGAANSGMAWALTAYGAFGVVFLGYLFFSASSAPFVNKFFALLYLCFGYSHAFPPAWVLLAMDKQREPSCRGRSEPHNESLSADGQNRVTS